MSLKDDYKAGVIEKFNHFGSSVDITEGSEADEIYDFTMGFLRSAIAADPSVLAVLLPENFREEAVRRVMVEFFGYSDMTDYDELDYAQSQMNVDAVLGGHHE